MCHVCGDFSTRLLMVCGGGERAKTSDCQVRGNLGMYRAEGAFGVKTARTSRSWVFWPRYASGK